MCCVFVEPVNCKLFFLLAFLVAYVSRRMRISSLVLAIILRTSLSTASCKSVKNVKKIDNATSVVFHVGSESLP